jgi:hypothetical protein
VNNGREGDGGGRHVVLTPWVPLRPPPLTPHPLLVCAVSQDSVIIAGSWSGCINVLDDGDNHDLTVKR